MRYLNNLITVFLFFLLILFSGCSGEDTTENEEITVNEHLRNMEKLEDQFMNIVNTNPGSPELNSIMLRLVEEYRLFADTHPEHEKSPEVLFKAANLRADGLNEYQNAITIFNRIRREYPDSEQSEKALFLIGYTQSEYLKDYDKARESYELFLEQYPESELAPSVQAELQFLGKDIDEILNQFESQN